MWPISWRKPELTAVTAATAAARAVTAAEEHSMRLWMDRLMVWQKLMQALGMCAMLLWLFTLCVVSFVMTLHCATYQHIDLHCVRLHNILLHWPCCIALHCITSGYMRGCCLLLGQLLFCQAHFLSPACFPPCSLLPSPFPCPLPHPSLIPPPPPPAMLHVLMPPRHH